MKCLYCNKTIGFNRWYHCVYIDIKINDHFTTRNVHESVHQGCLASAKKTSWWQDIERTYTVGERELDTIFDCRIMPEAA